MSKTLAEKFNSPGPKRILSLDGGGIRGVLTIGLLEELEATLRKQHNDPNLLLCDYFDLIGGTSTGSILASGLAVGMSTSELREYYFNMGGVIFGKKKNIINYLTKGEKYDVKPLNKALQEVFGDIKLGDQEKIKTGLCIVTKRADTFSTWPFLNHPEAKFYKENKDFPLWKIIRASAAAPTYFLPITLDLGNNETGTFIDGGISMANNPAFSLLMAATLRGFPFHWPMGPENLLLVSMGTGNLQKKYNYEDVKQKSVMAWAGMLPDYFMADANFYNQILLQILSDSPTARKIDSEIGKLEYDSLNGKHALSYLRYDVDFSKDFLSDLGFDFTAKEILTLSEMDNQKNTKILYAIGKKAGEKQIKASHFSKIFTINQQVPETLKRFTQNKKPKLEFESFTKNPIPVQAVEITEPFEVETMEGIMRGKPGDYLMRGIEGELYVCDKKIFHKTYTKIKPE